MKEDLKDLTYLVSYFAENKSLPERQLVLETLDDDKISTMRQSGLRELLRFVEVLGVHSDGLNDSAALETGHQLGLEPSVDGGTNPINQAIGGVPAAHSQFDQDWLAMDSVEESFHKLLQAEEHFVDPAWLENYP